MSTVSTRVDDVELFASLADRMVAESERFEHLGDVEIDLALVMRRGGDATVPGTAPEPDARSRPGDFRVLLTFRGITCDAVYEIPEGAERAADCWLEGTLADWDAMFADIAAHGHATGSWTLNALTVFGDRIRLHAVDPMGEDRFHRFNQTLQEFFDGAAVAADNTKE